MDGVKAWCAKSEQRCAGLVAELQVLRADAGDCDFDVKNASTRTTACPARRCGRVRPCGAFSVKLYRAAGATIREGVLCTCGAAASTGGRRGACPKDSKWRMPQHGARRSRIRAGSRARHAAKRNAWFVTVLRDPVQRAE